MHSLQFFSSIKFSLSQVLVSFCFVVIFSTLPAHAQTPIRISVQPANYSMLAVHVATQNGYWKEAGLIPSIVTYPAGVPQIKAKADWDIGLTGAVPALIAAREHDMMTIAIADNQSRTNGLLASKEVVQKSKIKKPFHLAPGLR
ncbi:MAG: hypothetical protein HC765_02090 [Brachymonas sp.]|nr:hypothetical protein [Brachymonas sp.]